MTRGLVFSLGEFAGMFRTRPGGVTVADHVVAALVPPTRRVHVRAVVWIFSSMAQTARAIVDAPDSLARNDRAGRQGRESVPSLRRYTRSIRMSFSTGRTLSTYQEYGA